MFFFAAGAKSLLGLCLAPFSVQQIAVGQVQAAVLFLPAVPIVPDPLLSAENRDCKKNQQQKPLPGSAPQPQLPMTDQVYQDKK